RLPPSLKLPETLADSSSADSFFIDHSDLYEEIGKTLDDEFAMVMFAESGFRSVNEHAFIRKIAQPNELASLLDSLATKEEIEKVEEAYFVRSALLSLLIGSRLCRLRNFYIQIADSALIMASRRGLVELMKSDYERRQVVLYESFFEKIKENIPEKISGLVVGGEDLFTYLQPFLKQNNYIESIAKMGDHITIATHKNGSKIDFTLNTYNDEDEEKPFIENWLLSTDGSLTDAPVLANIRGSASKEVIMATSEGKVYVLAADGTLIQTYTTNGATPIGSPVAFDWYNSGQKVIMVAAGNKIFAWSINGELLPRFPFSMDEKITTTLTVNDLNKNGTGDVIVATANRRLHVLNARGEPLVGWPVRTNAVVKENPLVTRFRNQT